MNGKRGNQHCTKHRTVVPTFALIERVWLVLLIHPLRCHASLSSLSWGAPYSFPLHLVIKLVAGICRHILRVLDCWWSFHTNLPHEYSSRHHKLPLVVSEAFQLVLKPEGKQQPIHAVIPFMGVVSDGWFLLSSILVALDLFETLVQ